MRLSYLLLEGSEFAELVQNPLPIEFSVTEDEATTVSPEVLVVGENDTPEDFGYVAFGFQIVDTQYFYITLNDISTQPATLLTGKISIFIESIDYLEEKDLVADVNKIRIPLVDNSDDIIITIHAVNYDVTTRTLNSDQIESTSLNNPFQENYGEEVTKIHSVTSTSRNLDLLETLEVNKDEDLLVLDNGITLSDIENLEGYTYVIGNKGGYPIIIEIHGERGSYDDKTLNIYKFPEDNANLLHLVVAGDYLLATSSHGEIYRINMYTKSYMVHDYGPYSDGFTKNLYASGTDLFIHEGNNLYKSIDWGASFDLINNNVGSSSARASSSNEKPRRFIFTYDNVAYNLNSPCVDKSTDAGNTFDCILDGIDSNSKIYHYNGKVLIATPNTIIADQDGNNSFVYYNTQPNDGNLINVAVVDGDTRLFFEYAVYDFNTSNPD